MIDEIKAGQALEKAQRANSILRSEIFNEAFSTLEREYLEAWKITHINDDKGRERLWQAINLLGKVKGHFLKLADGGKLASKDLAEIKYLKR